MYLSDEFIQQYENKTPPFGPLGMFVALRTYMRWLEDKGRREKWHEVCRRVVEYSMSLYQGPAIYDRLKKEAEDLFDALFNLQVFAAGRTYWSGGTEASLKNPLSNFNCAHSVVDSFTTFVDAFYLLMLGCGMGFRVLFDDVSKLPQINTNIVLAHKPYHPKAKHERIENTQTYEGDGSVYIIVGDSRSGWTQSLDQYLKAIQRSDIESIIINYDSVRPAGEPLKTFGGRASGHQSIKQMFAGIHTVIKNSTGKLKPIDCMDIMCLIADNVCVGGVRRSSLICLFDEQDEEILNAKVDLYEKDSNNFGKNWRSNSNNTIFFENKPNKERLLAIFDRIFNSAEPGFLGAEAARKRRPWFEGINPCAEILLSKGTCNLTTVNVMSAVENGLLNVDKLVQSIKLATRIGLRQTNVDQELPEWDYTQKRDRLTGVSMTGIMDMLDATNLSRYQWNDICLYLNEVANNEAVKYAKEMRVPTPLLVTCIKPEGSLSQLPTVSSGIHRSFAPYYIRRVRISSTDPLAKVMLDLGYPVYPDRSTTVKEFDTLSNREKINILEKSHTWVIEFPIKTNAVMRASDESAKDQFQRYIDMQRYYVDHNTSITIYFSENEIDGLVDMILENWDDYIAVSFMPKDTTAYPLLPYEEISEAEYNIRAQLLSHITDNKIIELLTELERENMMSELMDSDCQGSCPVR